MNAARAEMETANEQLKGHSAKILTPALSDVPAPDTATHTAPPADGSSAAYQVVRTLSDLQHADNTVPAEWLAEVTSFPPARTMSESDYQQVMQ